MLALKCSLKSGPPKLSQKRGKRNGAPVALAGACLSAFCCLLERKRRQSGENALPGRVLVILLLQVCPAVSPAAATTGACIMSPSAPTPPQGNRVTICHAYTCKQQTPYTFSRADIAEIAAIMTKVKRADSPFEERRAVAYAIAKMETDGRQEARHQGHSRHAVQLPRAIPPSRIASTRPPTPPAISWC